MSDGPLISKIKELELAGRDLLTVVKYSELDYEPVLTEHLNDFIGWSYTINKNLQELQVRSQNSLKNAISKRNTTKEPKRTYTLFCRFVIKHIQKRYILILFVCSKV